MRSVQLAIPIERRIWIIRGKRVMFDVDLAEIYGTATKRLNEQVSRNKARFPADFAFRLTPLEIRTIFHSRSQFATLKRGENIKHPPFVFTEYGAVMLASVLNSPVATKASIQVVKAFVRLRELISRRDGLRQKIERVERRVRSNSQDIKRIFDVLQDLIKSPNPPAKRKIGFLA